MHGTKFIFQGYIYSEIFEIVENTAHMAFVKSFPMYISSVRDE